MADNAYWNAGDRPRVWINWRTFTDQGIPGGWQQPFQDAVINAYTRWMMSAGVDCRFQFFGYTDRTEAGDGEVLITMNERHFDTSRIASTFTSWRKANMVIHRKNGSDLTNWNIVPYNAAPGEIDLQGVLTHEFGHCYWLDHSSLPNDTMVANYDYHRQRYGPWEGDVARAKAIFADFDRNHLRELGSADGGQFWNVLANQLTPYNNYQARTCLSPGVSAIGHSGLFDLAWSHPNRIPTWLRTDSSTFLFNNWTFYGGERAVHGHAIASAADGTMLWCWVGNDDNGTIKIVRSTDSGASWVWTGTPSGAATFGQPGIAVTTVAGQRTWILVWAHFDRTDQANTGYLRTSISSDDGSTWSTPQVLDTFYKSLLGVGIACDDNNHVMVGFSWAPNSTYGINYVRTLHCAVAQGALNGSRVGYTSEVSRVHPALAFDSQRNRFVMAFREQNFLTSLRITIKNWADAFWPVASQVQGTTTNTAPALAASPAAELYLWFGGE
jgi:matrixin